MHRLSVAVVIRSGDTTALVSLPEWFHGVLLVPAEARVLANLAGVPARDLPGTRFYVRACLDALTEAGLRLGGWSLTAPGTAQPFPAPRIRTVRPADLRVHRRAS